MHATSRIGVFLLLILVAELLRPAPAVAQQGSTRSAPRQDTLTVHRDTLEARAPQPFQTRPFVMANTLRVERNGTPLPPAAVQVEAVRGRLWVRPLQRLTRSDTLVAVYRTFPLDLRRVYRRRSIDSLRTAPSGPGAETPAQAPQRPARADSLRPDRRRTLADTLAETGYVVVEEEGSDTLRTFDPFAGVDLQRSGSISRGVTGGTNQDAGIESGLRLQLEGNLTDDVAVRALLTDQNTPIQPEGTTRRLDDFDRVFIELETPQAVLQLGDVDVSFTGTEFGVFNRKIQGATVQSETLGPSLGLTRGEAKVFGAVSRGQYRTQDIHPIDGVQGPYRLEGAEGERFVVVVAGTERVYLDGQRLERGRTNDYIIDYTRAELTFTSNRIITEDQRITVEFQYRTSQFDRTLIGGRADAAVWVNENGRPRASVGASYLREADGQDFGAAFNLSPEDSLALVNAGDDPAVRSGARRVEFDPEAPYIFYRRDIRSTPAGTDTVFVALEEAPDEGTEVFRVDFARVGSGNGAYVRVGRQQNGILYEYRGPGQGEYQPLQPIPRPQMQQLIDLTAQVEPVSGVQLFGEWARSMNDDNRFSPLDRANDVGRGYLAGARILPVSIEAGKTSLGEVSLSVRRRARGETFQTFDQSRDIEFNREWNLARTGSSPAADVVEAGEEILDRAEMSWAWAHRSSASGSLGRLRFGDAFDAQRARGRLRLQEPGLPRVAVSAEWVDSRNRIAGTRGTWTRQQHEIRQPLGILEPSIGFDREVRDQRDATTGQATTGAFAFTEWEPGVAVTAGRLDVDSRVAYRLEDETLNGRTIRAARAVTATAAAEWTPTNPYDVSVQTGYRVRRFTEPFERAGRSDTESLILQLDAGTQPLDRAIDARIFYDARTEREPTLQEVYVRTGPELGQFVWTDDNGDGLQQVDEFVPETTPNEGAYVQSFVPSDSLASVVSIDTRLRVRLEPRRIWRTSTARWRRWLSRVETRSTIEIQEKSRSDRLTDLYLLNPDALRQEGETVDGTLRLQQDVLLFPRSRRAGVDVTWTQARGLTERAAGQERSLLNAWEAATRWRISPAWTVRLSGAVQVDRSISEAFSDTRSYDIFAQQIQPEVSFRPSAEWSLTGSAAIAAKKDAIGNRNVRLLRVPVEATWATAGRFRVTANGEVADIVLDGDAAGLARFELTEGRGPGRSYLWGARGEYQVSGNIRATFAYDGRAPAAADVIHTFRINVSAQF